MDGSTVPAVFRNPGVERALGAVRDALAWAPDWMAALAVLFAALALALLVHRIAMGLLRRTLGRRGMLRPLIEATRRPSRLALCAFALAVAMRVAPLAPAVRLTLMQALLVTVVVLIGWIAHVAVRLASDLYLGRFELETADNLLARKHVTQVRILRRAADTVIIVITLAAALMTFESVRQYGLSLFASAGVAGLVAGLAARPLLSNLIAGVQLAVTQPIRIDDVVIVEGEWGRIEEITSTYVVVRIWDLRRLVVPLTYFIEKPFQNWTRSSAQIIGAVLVYCDYTVPVARLRAAAEAIVRGSPHWDGDVFSVQVTDARSDTIELRVLASAANSGLAWELRCEIREKLIDLLQRDYPDALPRRRATVVLDQPAGDPAPPPPG